MALPNFLSRLNGGEQILFGVLAVCTIVSVCVLGYVAVYSGIEGWRNFRRRRLKRRAYEEAHVLVKR